MPCPLSFACGCWVSKFLSSHFQERTFPWRAVLLLGCPWVPWNPWAIARPRDWGPLWSQMISSREGREAVYPAYEERHPGPRKVCLNKHRNGRGRVSNLVLTRILCRTPGQSFLRWPCSSLGSSMPRDPSCLLVRKVIFWLRWDLNWNDYPWGRGGGHFPMEAGMSAAWGLHSGGSEERRRRWDLRVRRAYRFAFQWFPPPWILLTPPLMQFSCVFVKPKINKMNKCMPLKQKVEKCKGSLKPSFVLVNEVLDIT